nr:MAG TPA: hypothetical protein [Caudoviricetes sp.]
MTLSELRRKQLDHERYMRNREARKEKQKKYYREHWWEYKCKRMGMEDLLTTP